MKIISFDSVHEISFAWEENFPKGYGHTSIAYLKRCPSFICAKNGDMNAAIHIVERCVKVKRINDLEENYPNSVLLPVINGRNVLPLALAQRISLPVWKDVILRSTISRKNLLAIQRLLHKPIFIGYIQKGLDYIIVDDIVTQGGTISALREFVIARGGRVVAVVALAFSIGSHYIAPTKEILIRLFLKFGNSLYKLELEGFVGSFAELTYSQIRYLIKFSSVQNIYSKIEKENCLPQLFKTEKNNIVHEFIKTALIGRDDVAFVDELSYFPQLEKDRTFKIAENYALNNKLVEFMERWNSFSSQENRS